MTRLSPFALAIVIAGCGGSPEQEPRQVEGPSRTAPGTSRWIDADGAEVTAINDAALAAKLEAATSRAQETIDDARERWAATPEDERSGWAIKWGARTTSGDLEYVWVVPERWSPFRIEGVLSSTPVRPLECGKAHGERVGFAAEAVADWMYERADGTRDGGFTVDILDGS